LSNTSCAASLCSIEHEDTKHTKKKTEEKNDCMEKIGMVQNRITVHVGQAFQPAISEPGKWQAGKPAPHNRRLVCYPKSTVIEPCQKIHLRVFVFKKQDSVLTRTGS